MTATPSNSPPLHPELLRQLQLGLGDQATLDLSTPHALHSAALHDLLERVSESYRRMDAERTRAEAGMQRAHHMLFGAMDAMENAFAWFDPDDRLVMSNQRYKEVHPVGAAFMVPGHTYRQILRAGAEAGLYPKAIGRIDEWLEERMVLHHQPRSQIQATLADGRSWRIIEHRLADGTVLVFHVDISDFVRSVQTAEAASRAKTRFLANMSHELRTPLNAVIGAAQLIKAGDNDPERQQQLVDAIQRSGTNLLGLVEDILDLSRIEAGELTLSPQDFHLFDCLDAALATAGLSARAKGLRLACIADPALSAWRHADAARLRQVLINLLGNAIKFTDKGDIVVRVQGGPSRADVRITVSDTGVGISAAALPHVFEPFRQGDERSGRRFGGSGLGLAIVRQLVTAMGGAISVQSEPGAGSVFSLVVPLALTGAVPEAPAQNRQRVAFVEPHPASAEALHALLTRMGYEARRCIDAKEIRRWCNAAASGMDNAWLLVCTDTPAHASLLEQTRDVLVSGRVIGMSSESSPLAASGNQRFALTRTVVKPVSRAALASRLLEPAEDRAWMASAPMSLDVWAPSAAHILVVEDDALNQAIVSRLLQHAGYRVSVVPDGQSALAAWRDQHYDLVLMDWQMPDMDGLEVTRRMRAAEAGEAARVVPIVALTANAFAEDRDACLAAGMNDFLTKPVHAAGLAATILRWLAPAASGRPGGGTHHEGTP